MFDSLPVSGPQNPMTSVAVLAAPLVMNAFCISEVQHKAKGGRIGFPSEFASSHNTQARAHGLYVAEVDAIYKHLMYDWE